MPNYNSCFKNNKIVSVAAFLVLASPFVAAQQYNMELKGEYESWDTGSEFGGETSAVIGGAGLGYYQGDYYAGGGFSTGSYVLNNNSDKTIQRTDLDLVIGKKIDKQWSLFTGYRFNWLEYSLKGDASATRRENTAGVGLGASFGLPFTPRWIAFMSGVVSGLYAFNNFDESGKGFALGTEGGLLYSVNRKTSIAVRAKYQNTKISYDTNRDWTHSYIRLGAHLGYVF